MLRAAEAEAEAQAEAARAMIGANIGPDVNSATLPVHGARNRKGCTEVAKLEAPDLFSQFGGLKSTNIAHAHSMVKKLPPVCCSLSHLHPVSKMVASPWGQIWVTDFGAGQDGFVGHGGSRFAPGSNGERIMKRKFIARRMAYWIS